MPVALTVLGAIVWRELLRFGSNARVLARWCAR